MTDEGGAWLTYAEAGDRLGVSPDAVRAKALRKRWRRQIGNDGRARIWLPEDERSPADRLVTGRSSPERENERSPDHPPVSGRSSRGHRAVDFALVRALESHINTLQGDIETLREQFAAAEAQAAADLAAERERADKQAAESVDREARAAADLAAERERADKQAAEWADREARAAIDLAAERERADKAISAFASLADRLDAMAAANQQRRPWWGRLVS
jgi:hypothetical protein